MTTVRFILSLAILLFAAYIAAMNWGCVIVSRRNKRRGIDRHYSPVFLLTFIFALLALFLYPHPDKAVWMLAVPVLDIGNWAVFSPLIWFPVKSIRGSKKKKSNEPDAGGESR